MRGWCIGSGDQDSEECCDCEDEEGWITWGLASGEEERRKALNGGLSKTCELIACGRGSVGGRRVTEKGVSTSAAETGKAGRGLGFS